MRAAVPSRQILTLDVVPEPDALAESAFVIGVAAGDTTGPLHAINRIACARGIPWLPIRVMPDSIRFGPTVLAGTTACLLCTALREAAHGPNPPTPFPSREGGARAGQDARTESPPPSEGGGRGVGILAALEALQTLLGAPSRARGRVGLLDAVSGAWTWHPVLRHPRCPVCGALPWSPPSPPSRVGGVGLSAPFVDDETGIVRAVVSVQPPPGEPTPPHIAMAFLANTQFRDDWDSLPPGDQTATGKGRTADEARDAAIGEGLERYCATLSPAPGAFRVAPYAVLDQPVRGPAMFGLYHPTQYADGSVPYAP
ncbi:MAG: TOMM precursor leader peptide-binding protein, partial [Chloroflexota bacterium]|nr:TOMM precursor leader peptide-binding protein [Chloroflexota bacterium]